MQLSREQLESAARHVIFSQKGLFRTEDWVYDAAVYPLYQLGGSMANSHQNRQAVADLVRTAEVTVKFKKGVTV